MIAGNVEHEEGDCPLPRYRPDGIDALCKATGFSRKELQLMYRSFKQVLHHRLMNGQRSQYRSFPLVSTGAQPSLQRSNLISVYSLLTYRKIKAKTTSAETREIEFVKASHVAIRISSIIYSNQTFPYSTKQLICQFLK